MFRELVVFVLSLDWECVGVEPVHQRLVEAEADIRHLRSMDVSVDEARQEELRLAEANFLEFTLPRMIPSGILRRDSNLYNLKTGLDIFLQLSK